MKRYLRCLVPFSIISIVLSGCALSARNPLPQIALETARIEAMPRTIRALGLTKSSALSDDFANALVDGGTKQECDKNKGQPVFCVLVISGGGGRGAYGAGFLKGWTASKHRPEFKIVTGVSTGALIAPFAFLGSKWDHVLEEAYTTIENDSDVVSSGSVLRLAAGDSYASSEPLMKRIVHHFDGAMLEAVAQAYRSGRRLYIGTTNLDAQNFTVWNMGAIASAGGPKALDLFRKVLLASTSIPILMPPVLIHVKHNGQVFDEIHVDGGLQAQFFVPLAVINLPEAISKAQSLGFPHQPSPRMFIIRNAKFKPAHKSINRNVGEITARTVGTMIQAMGRSDLNQIYAISKARGSGFNYTEVPPDFVWASDQQFDGNEMRRLFKIGYDRGKMLDPWQHTPPGLFAANAGLEPAGKN